MVAYLRASVALHEQIQLRLRLLDRPARLQPTDEKHAVIVDGLRGVYLKRHPYIRRVGLAHGKIELLRQHSDQRVLDAIEHHVAP